MARNRNREPLSWRGDAPYSDWSVGVENRDKESGSLYRVHKNILAVGPRSCDYFDGVFASSTREQNDNMSVVEFDGFAAECFPLFLDFLYNETVEYTLENALGLYHLANYFGCEALMEEVMDFIQEELAENAAFFLKNAFECGETEIEELARAYLIENIQDVDEDAFNAYRPELFRSVVFSQTLMSSKVTHAKQSSIKNIWSSYSEANPDLPEDIRVERGIQDARFGFGKVAFRFLDDCKVAEELRALEESTANTAWEEKENEFLANVSPGIPYWYGLVLNDFLAIDNSPRGVDGGTAYVAKILQQAQEDYMEVVEENESLETQVDGLATENEGLTIENDGLKVEVDGLKAEISGVKTENGDLKVENRLLQVENDALKALTRGVKTENDSVKAENEKLKKEVEGLPYLWRHAIRMIIQSQGENAEQ